MNKQLHKDALYLLRQNDKYIPLIYTFDQLSFIPKDSWNKVNISIKEWSILSGLSVSAVRNGFKFLKQYNIIYPDKTVNEGIYKLSQKSLQTGMKLGRIIEEAKQAIIKKASEESDEENNKMKGIENEQENNR